MTHGPDPGESGHTERPLLHPLLATRFSPLVFDPAHVLTDVDEHLLLEAARWAPSAGNSQPWMFHFRRRGRPGHDRLLARLAPSSARWAPSASALVVNLAHRNVEDTDWQYSEFADYDLGQAVAHMTIQATAMGLACRQFRSFDLDALTTDLLVPQGWAVVSMTAIGRAVDSGPSRERRSIEDLRLPHPGPPPNPRREPDAHRQIIAPPISAVGVCGDEAHDRLLECHALVAVQEVDAVAVAGLPDQSLVMRGSVAEEHPLGLGGAVGVPS